MLMPTLPKYVQRWAVDESVIGLVTGIFTVSAVLVRPLVGRELDRQGRRGIYPGSLGLPVGSRAYSFVDYPSFSRSQLGGNHYSSGYHRG